MNAQSSFNEIEAFVDDVFDAAETQAALAAAEPAFLPDDPVLWIETEFYVPETGAPIVLEPYQRAVIREALRKDDDGLYVYSLVLWSDLKKSAKSTIAAAVSLFMAWHYPWESVRIVGNDLKQANSRTFFYIERAIKLNPRLRARCSTKTYHIGLPNETTIEAIAVDPKGEAGGGDLIVCFTELWAAKNAAAKQLWTETTLSPLKYGRSLRWCESYAGFKGGSPILEQLYKQGVKAGRLIDVGIDGLELYANDAARMLCLWNTKPRCTWQTQEYYTQEAATLEPSEFARVHANEWQTDADAFVPPEWWDACKAVLPDLSQFQQLVVGVDAAVSGDCFAIVAVSRHEEQVAVRYSRIWTPPKGGKLNYGDEDDGLDDTPWAFLVMLVKTGRVALIAYDEYQLHDFMTRFKRKHGVWCKSFSQGADRLIADKRLHDMIKERRVLHDGSHGHLNEHVKQAGKKSDGDNKLRIIKLQDEDKIDAAVATSMATEEAMRLTI